MTKETKIATILAVMGIATGAFAVLVWPLMNRRSLQPIITVLPPTIKPVR